jgi:hypothetical protein
VIFVGIDWAEAHHDVCVLDHEGGVLIKGRVPDGVEGVSRTSVPVHSPPSSVGSVIATAQTAVGSAAMAEMGRPSRSTEATTVFVAGSIRSSVSVEAAHTASSVAAIRLRHGVSLTGISARTSFGRELRGPEHLS